MDGTVFLLIYWIFVVTLIPLNGLDVLFVVVPTPRVIDRVDHIVNEY